MLTIHWDGDGLSVSYRPSTWEVKRFEINLDKEYRETVIKTEKVQRLNTNEVMCFPNPYNEVIHIQEVDFIGGSWLRSDKPKKGEFTLPLIDGYEDEEIYNQHQQDMRAAFIQKHQDDPSDFD